MEYNTYTTSHGLRVIHAGINSEVSYLGFAIDVGSRNEREDEHGMAHFVEHCLFKGTKKRKFWHILNRMEHVGGELNAYTSKEETLIYSVFLEKDLERAFELLSDLVVNSQFPESELQKEKEVILDEINSYEDTPSELIFDEFENMLFENHPLGHNILGTKDLLSLFSQKNVFDFFQRYYQLHNIVLFYLGKTDPKKLIRYAEKYIPKRELTSNLNDVKALPVNRQQKHVQVKKETHQAHVIIGNYAYSLHHPKRTGLNLLNNMLGGPGMNSRLNVSLRERSGLVYSVESSITSFTDSGIFMVYFGTEQKNVNTCLRLIQKELQRFCTQKLTDNQLHIAKRQLMGQVSIAREQREQTALSMGKSFLRFGKYDALPTVYQKIEAISAEDILDIANEIFNEEQLSTLIFK